MGLMGELCPILQELQDGAAWDALIQSDKKRARYERNMDMREQFYNVRQESIFSICKGERMRKKPRVHVGEKTGSFVLGVRVGAYTTCVCKHRRAE